MSQHLPDRTLERHLTNLPVGVVPSCRVAHLCPPETAPVHRVGFGYYIVRHVGLEPTQDQYPVPFDGYAASALAAAMLKPCPLWVLVV